MSVPVPTIIAYSEKRKNEPFIAKALITVGIENTSNLMLHLNEHSELADNKKWLLSVVDQLVQQEILKWTIF